MAKHSNAPPPKPEFGDVEYCLAGGWRGAVENLTRCLYAFSCHEFAHRFDRDLRSAPPNLTSPKCDAIVESVALKRVWETLASLYSSPLRYLTPEQYKELDALRSLAKQCVHYQRQHLGRTVDATRKAEADVEAERNKWAAGALPEPVVWSDGKPLTDGMRGVSGDALAMLNTGNGATWSPALKRSDWVRVFGKSSGTVHTRLCELKAKDQARQNETARGWEVRRNRLTEPQWVEALKIDAELRTKAVSREEKAKVKAAAARASKRRAQ